MHRHPVRADGFGGPLGDASAECHGPRSEAGSADHSRKSHLSDTVSTASGTELSTAATSRRGAGQPGCQTRHDGIGKTRADAPPRGLGARVSTWRGGEPAADEGPSGSTNAAGDARRSMSRESTGGGRARAEFLRDHRVQTQKLHGAGPAAEGDPPGPPGAVGPVPSATPGVLGEATAQVAIPCTTMPRRAAAVCERRSLGIAGSRGCCRAEAVRGTRSSGVSICGRRTPLPGVWGGTARGETVSPWSSPGSNWGRGRLEVLACSRRSFGIVCRGAPSRSPPVCGEVPARVVDRDAGRRGVWPTRQRTELPRERWERAPRSRGAEPSVFGTPSGVPVAAVAVPAPQPMCRGAAIRVAWEAPREPEDAARA